HYRGKPLQMEDVVARVRGLARRAVGQRSTILENGVVEIDMRRKSVSVAGSNVAITALEYRLLA
ncbi:MAG: DNA-binding response regulator, partial [Alphaproteobacteria bacterium]